MASTGALEERGAGGASFRELQLRAIERATRGVKAKLKPGGERRARAFRIRMVATDVRRAIALCLALAGAGAALLALAPPAATPAAHAQGALGPAERDLMMIKRLDALIEGLDKIHAELRGQTALLERLVALEEAARKTQDDPTLFPEKRK